MKRHVVVMRWLNRLRFVRWMWGPRAVEWYFWRFVWRRR